MQANISSAQKYTYQIEKNTSFALLSSKILLAPAHQVLMVNIILQNWKIFLHWSCQIVLSHSLAFNFLAGYRMMAVTDPALCRRVTLRHSIAQIPVALMLPLYDVTNWWFMLEVTPVNLYLTFLALKFYQDSNNNSSRKLFRFSLLHLPLVMLLALINIKRQQNNPDPETIT